MTSADVDWEHLEHAYGPASDLPPILKQFGAARGRRLYSVVDELCSRVLHQGTIYSASPPVARYTVALLQQAKTPERVMFYSMLTGFADSARQAISCSAIGQPADGEAIKAELLQAHQTFVNDLQHVEAEIRSQAAEVLTAFPEVAPASLKFLRERYFAEEAPSVRHSILQGFLRLEGPLPDWREFLADALETEQHPPNIYLLLTAQVQSTGPETEPEIIEELLRTHPTGDGWLDPTDPLFRTLHRLGPARERSAMLRALALNPSSQLALSLAERLLRSAFNDQRSNWGGCSYGKRLADGSPPPQPGKPGMLFHMRGLVLLTRLLPGPYRWWLRRQAATDACSGKYIEYIEYYGLIGARPAIPSPLTEEQADLLTTLADTPLLWQFRTNLWSLFQLPDSAEALKRFADR